jgi:hypothetical protein
VSTFRRHWPRHGGTASAALALAASLTLTAGLQHHSRWGLVTGIVTGDVALALLGRWLRAS